MSEEKLASTSTACHVCGVGGASKHYGAITCQRCKVFFIRAVTVDKEYRCRQKGTCSYPESKCRLCRYNKCIQVGMIPETVARREGCTRQLKRFSRPTKVEIPEYEEIIDVEVDMETENRIELLKGDTREPSPPVFADEERLSQPSTSSAISVNYVRTFDVAGPSNGYVAPSGFSPSSFLLFSNYSPDIVGNLLNLERICAQDSPTSSIVPFNVFLNLGVSELLQNPTLLAPRGPLAYSDPYPPLTSDRNQLTQMVFARKLLYYVDWLRGTPEFWELSENDRCLLCIQQYNPMICLSMIYSTYRMNSDGVLHGLGVEANRVECPFGNECALFMNYMIDFVHKYVISAMREVNLGEEEYVLFKNVLLFNTSLLLSDAGTRIVKTAHAKYSAELIATMRQKALPFESETIVEKRVATLFGLQGYILNVAHRSHRFFGRVCGALNFGDLRGQLTQELFFSH